MARLRFVLYLAILTLSIGKITHGMPASGHRGEAAPVMVPGAFAEAGCRSEPVSTQRLTGAEQHLHIEFKIPVESDSCLGLRRERPLYPCWRYPIRLILCSISRNSIDQETPEAISGIFPRKMVDNHG